MSVNHLYGFSSGFNSHPLRLGRPRGGALSAESGKNYCMHSDTYKTLQSKPRTESVYARKNSASTPVLTHYKGYRERNQPVSIKNCSFRGITYTLQPPATVSLCQFRIIPSGKDLPSRTCTGIISLLYQPKIIPSENHSLSTKCATNGVRLRQG